MAEAPRFEVLPFDATLDRAAFSCGVEPLDRYFKQQARQDIKRNVAAVFVLRPVDTPRTVAGYYTMSMSVIYPASLPPEVAKRYPPYRELPAALIGRLAVDSRFQGKGIGRVLMLSALSRCLRLPAEIGGMAVIVDAKDDGARTFYEHYDFQRMADDPYRLYLPMAMIRDLLAE